MWYIVLSDQSCVGFKLNVVRESMNKVTTFTDITLADDVSIALHFKICCYMLYVYSALNVLRLLSYKVDEVYA